MAAQSQKRTQPSTSAQQKQAMKKFQASGEMLNYIGLLPDTFVSPTGSNLPSLFSDFRGRKTVEWHRFKSWLALLQSRVVAFWLVKPRLDLEVGKAARIAKDLYVAMYTAFAEGNLTTINQKLAHGLRGSLESRIAQRAPNVFLQWKVHRFIGSPKRVSFRFAMPDTKGPNTQRTGIIQAVVRIKSEQSLLHMRRQKMRNPATKQMVIAAVPIDRDGNEIVDFDQEKEEKKNMKVMTEYFVIERMLIKGVLGQWRVWGTTEETDLSKLKKMERENSQALLSRG